MKQLKRRTSGRKIKRNIYAAVSLMVLVLSIATPLIQVFADDGGEGAVTEAYGKYAGESKNTHEVLGKFSGETVGVREEGFVGLFSRIFVPGYMNDVSKGVPSSKIKDSPVLGSDGSYYICDPSEPNNLIATNCDLPNFSSQLGQAVMRVFSPGGIENGERVTAKPIFAWGVPNGIPGNSVPVNESQRSKTYTGLEVFGYNVQYTDYNGEWDDIIPSTRARMLANFGFMDTLNLTGTAIWNGVQGGMSELVEGFSWNPATWLGNISSAIEVGGSNSFLTILDTSELNVAATRGWVRSGSSVGSTFYNVKVLTDKEVMEESAFAIQDIFKGMFSGGIENSPELQYVMSMETPPTFTFNPELESEESKKARSDAEAKNKDIDAQNIQIDKDNESIKAHNAEVESSGKGDKKPLKDKKKNVKVPEKVFVPEKVQFADWKGEDSRVAEGEGVGISCVDKDNYGDYKACWSEKYKTYQKAEFSANSTTVSGILKNVKESLFKDNPYADPTKAISHYVCADDKGNGMRGPDGKYIHVYNAENSNGTESINKACKPIRPTIQGGYFGDGYGTGKSTDTRHISNYESKGIASMIPIIGTLKESVQNFAMAFSKFVAQLLNEMMNLAFSPLMENLGISTLVASTIESLKTTIFYPLVVLVTSFAALAMFWDAIRSRSLMRFFTTFGVMLLTFIIGVFLLTNPAKVVNFLDKGPAEAEQYLASLILNQSTNDGLCETNANDSKAGIRSAQCHIWASLVYQPWVFGQWGTAPNNLNVKGFDNTNGNLVGNAEVNLGGGKKVNNWAAYQMKLMTSGTITTADNSRPVGKADTDLYKIVDLQAGPNNGAGSDSRYLTNWTGQGNNRFGIAIESAILSIFMFIVIGGMLLTKIELTFIFSILLLGLPFMLLAGLLPKGRIKLKGYAATLASIFIKRMLVTVMISLMLLLLNLTIPDNATSYSIVFISGLIVLGFFKTYKKEIFNLFQLDQKDAFAGQGLLSGDPDAMREAVSNATPKYIKNQMYMAKHSAIGKTSGKIGGAIGGGAAVIQTGLKENRENKREKALAKANPLTYKPKNTRFITSSPKNVLANVRDGISVGAQEGARAGESAMSRRADLALTRQGLDIFSVKSRVKHQVLKEGSQLIKDGSQGLERDVFQDIEARRELKDNGNTQLSPAYQKQIRTLAKDISKNVSNTQIESLELMGIYTASKMDDIAKEQDDELTDGINRVSRFRPGKAEKIRENITIKDEVKVGTNVDEILEKTPEQVKEYNPEEPTRSEQAAIEKAQSSGKVDGPDVKLTQTNTSSKNKQERPTSNELPDLEVAQPKVNQNLRTSVDEDLMSLEQMEEPINTNSEQGENSNPNVLNSLDLERELDTAQDVKVNNDVKVPTGDESIIKSQEINKNESELPNIDEVSKGPSDGKSQSKVSKNGQDLGLPNVDELSTTSVNDDVIKAYKESKSSETLKSVLHENDEPVNLTSTDILNDGTPIVPNSLKGDESLPTMNVNKGSLSRLRNKMGEETSVELPNIEDVTETDTGGENDE